MSFNGRARSCGRMLAAFAVYACKDLGDALAEVGLFQRFQVGGLGLLVDAVMHECAPKVPSHRSQETADGHATHHLADDLGCGFSFDEIISLTPAQ